MSDIEEQKNDNASVQAFEPEFEEEERVQNEAEDIPSLNWDTLDGTLDRRNPADELKGTKLKWLENEISDEIVDQGAVLVPKYFRGAYGSRDYLRNLDSATYALVPTMGVPSHFVSISDGETIVYRRLNKRKLT